MTEVERVTRWMVYQYFRETGTAPELNRLSRLVGQPIDAMRDALAALEEAHQLVTDSSGGVVMAHPFAAHDAGYRVETASRAYQTNCAWDALSLPALLNLDARIHAASPLGRDELRLDVKDGALNPTLSVIHFLVPARDFWDDIRFT